MSTYGNLRLQRAPDKSRKELKVGPAYHRSISLSVVRVLTNTQSHVSLFRTENIYSGDLRYHSSNYDSAIQHTQHFGPTFTAKVLEEVSTKEDDDPQGD
ncbi:hypothetical protein TorRG33x02_348920 [Trema orientale]|uniref:Uncharacterized protein n=1 Tax=Trema orientale TaxID=63057 RepID=A0A2P5AJF5_TREOI|nr:hypothetical protein TorRG33x02_348920 [Trema orientale]